MPSDDIEHPVGRLGPEPDHSITSMVLPKPIGSRRGQFVVVRDYTLLPCQRKEAPKKPRKLNALTVRRRLVVLTDWSFI